MTFTFDHLTFRAYTIQLYCVTKLCPKYRFQLKFIFALSVNSYVKQLRKPRCRRQRDTFADVALFLYVG